MFTNHTHDALNPHSFPKTAPLKFLKSTQGEYWIATSDGGVVKCDSLFNILKVYKSGRNLIDQQSPYAEYDQFYHCWKTRMEGYGLEEELPIFLFMTLLLNGFPTHNRKYSNTSLQL